MNEKEWTAVVQRRIQSSLQETEPTLRVKQGYRLPYSHEIRAYKDGESVDTVPYPYETDLLVVEELPSGDLTPRVVIECKLERVSTHDAITYSDKAAANKRLHPYLRYGILVGGRTAYALPGRLFHHGLNFDFMLSWVAEIPRKKELSGLLNLIAEEVQASRLLEEVLYSSRSPDRTRFTFLHKRLEVR